MQQYRVGFRIAWRGGEVKPSARAKSATKRDRQRPDPLLAVTAELEEWFEVSLGELHETCLARPFDNDRLLPDRWLHAGSLLADGVMMQLDWAVQ
ncbi:hypothetical protein LJR255_004008 [Pararhizobium sp. LjRoot255]|uniref:hypothetical protein n=1 Tax=Pararhizobium sp. LjRoot255 TaxID=3342298 RepID=UPI003ED033E9